MGKVSDYLSPFEKKKNQPIHVFVNFVLCAAGTTRGDIQKFLMKRLVDLRRSGQQKRKALYNADNGLLTAEQRAVCFFKFAKNLFFPFLFYLLHQFINENNIEMFGGRESGQ